MTQKSNKNRVVVQFEFPQGDERLLKAIFLTDTVFMAQRRLRIIKYAGESALLGVCEYCNKTFESRRGVVGPESKAAIGKQFDAHTCKREDARQAAARS